MATYVDVPASGGITTDYEEFKVTFDGLGLALDTGTKAYIPYMPACTIVGWKIIADVSGSCVIDVYKAAYPTIPSASIAASAKPTLSSAQINSDTTLTGWTTTVADGDSLGFNVDSCTTCTRVTVVLRVLKS